MKYLVIGCGPGSMGEAIAYRLLLEKNSRIFLADQNATNVAHSMDKLRKLCHGSFSECAEFAPSARGLDILKEKDLLPLYFKNFDIIVSAVPASLNPMLVEAVILSNKIRPEKEHKTHFCDLGGVLQFSRKILTGNRAEKAKDLGVSIVPDCGLQPGLGNIMAVDLLKKFKPDIPVESIIIYVGGLPYNYRDPPYYKKLFNLKGLEEIYYNAPLVLSRGKPRRITKLSHMEMVSAREFGLSFGTEEIVTFEAAVTGGLGTLPYYLQGKVLTLQEKTLRFEGHYNRVKTIPREQFEEFFTRWLESFPVSEKDFTVMKVIARGESAVYGERVEVEKLFCVQSDTHWNSMQKSTGFTTAVLAKLIAEGKAAPGALPPEMALDSSIVLEALKNDFTIRECTTPLI